MCKAGKLTWNDVIAKYSKVLLNYLRGMGIQDGDAEEILSAYWLYLLNKQKKEEPDCGLTYFTLYHGGKGLQFFLKRGVKNRMIDLYRGNRLSSQVRDNDDTNRVYGEHPIDSTIEKEVIDFLERAVLQAIESLPPEQYVILVLNKQYKVQQANLAVMLGVNQTTVSRLMTSAQMTLREKCVAIVRSRKDFNDWEWEDIADSFHYISVFTA